MTLYLDTSAAVKLYIDEPFSNDVATIVTAERAASSVLIAAELLAAIGIARRQGRLSNSDANRVAESAISLLNDFLQLPVGPELCVHAGRLAIAHGLRGYDSVHLASALVLSSATGTVVTFATFDRALWRAARDEGLDAWPPGWGD